MKRKTTIVKKIIQLASRMNQDIWVSLLIIRYASPKYVPIYAQLEIEDFIDEHKQEETSAQIPWHIVEHASDGEYVHAIICALRLIIPNSSFLCELESDIQSAKFDETILCEMIDLLSSALLDDISLLQIYEYELSKVTENSSISGDFYTPSSVVHLMLNLLNINEGELYDPCCGNGAMLYHAKKLMPQRIKLQLYGQTADRFSYQICQANFFLHDISADLGDKPANALTRDLYASRKFDYILTNPPFNHSNWCDDTYPEYDARWQYGLAPRSNANFAWLQHIVSHLSEKGSAAVILPNGTLTTQTKAESAIRYGMLREGLVEAIVVLPAKIFYGTKIPCCIWFLKKSRKGDSTTLLIDASRFQLAGDKTVIRKNAHMLTELVLQHRNGTLQEKTDWYATVSLEDIAQKNFVLSPNFYTKAATIPLEPIRKNRQYFVELIDILYHKLGDCSLWSYIYQWKYMRASEHWKKELLPELYEVSGGLAKKKDSFGHGTAMVDVKTVIHHMFLPDSLSMCVNATKEEMQKYHIKTGDILLNRTSETIEELACCCIVASEQEAVYGSYIKCLRPIKDRFLNPLYMAAYFHSAIYRQEVRKVSPVYTTRANMNMERLSKIFIYYPEMAMQSQLGDTLIAICQFQEKCKDKKVSELLSEFIQLLVEQFITYPILDLQKRGIIL